jgi:hypothetical protein
MDAVGVVLMGVGVFLAYSAVKNEHPWTAFLSVLGKSTATTDSAKTAAGLAKAAKAPTPSTTNNPLAGGGNL